MADPEVAERWTCTNPSCPQANPQPLGEFLYRPLTGTRYKECSTCRKARLRANQKRSVEARIVYQKAHLLKVKDKE